MIHKNNYKSMSLLLLLALFTISTRSIGLHEEHKCTHDHQEIPEPDLIDVEEEYNPEGNDHTGRTLTSYSSLRTYGYYGLLSSNTLGTYIKNKLVPPILDYFSAMLKVKYPVSGSLSVSSSTVCSVTTPSALKSGVTADYVYFITTDTSSDYVASSYACSLASSSKRPLIGKTTISTTYMSATSDVLLHEKQMICIIHEVVHTLGFSKSLYAKWLTSSGTTMTGHVTSATLDGATSVVINAEPLTTYLRDFFGCSTLKGAYMENSGSSGTAGSHFERRQFAYEGMTSGLIYQMQFSQFTLAILESTGWYVPDYSYADPFFWGQNQGCSFLTGTCSASSYDEFCSGSGRGCTNFGRGGGSCSTDSRSDSCYWIHPSISYDCENDDAESYARLSSLQTFGRGAGSKCFTGTLSSSSSSASTTSFCFKYSCSGSGSSTKLTVTVGSNSVVCSASGTKTVTGYKGSINCPDPETFCDTVGAKACPRGCMGRGTCTDGACVCNSGYSGTDCALTS